MEYLISIFIAWLLVRFDIFKPPRGQLNCGIFGFSGSRPVDITKLRWLASENQSRGTDSTGIYGNHLFKDKGPAKVVMLMPGFLAAAKGARIVQGHTRSASAGYAVTKDNAHPFHYGYKDKDDPTEWGAEVVGAHNGFVIPEMLRHHEETFGFKQYFSVDSQLIFAALAKTGDVNVISRIEGGMAISFQMLSHNPNRLYLYKREQTRPLYIGDAADGLYYSSLEDSLKYIGCRSVWELNPNHLYTIELGEITDVYKMPDPILKSLAANVTRADWRAGVPPVELNALPVSVTSQTKMSVSGKQDRPSTKFGNSRGFSQNIDTVTNRVANEYKDKASIDTKFNMLIANISDELKKYNAFPLDASEVVSAEENHIASCGLVVHVVNQMNGKPLIAWAVLADGDRELAGITSANGITLIKIPISKCNSDIKFMAYSPVEEYGPYEFIITPEAARVLEVTLSIPFLKKGSQKETSTDSEAKSSVAENSCGNRKTSCDLPLFAPESTTASKHTEVHDTRVLSRQPQQISWGCTQEQIDRICAGANPADVVVPETDLEIPPCANFYERTKSSILKLPKGAQDVTIFIALETTPSGGYKNLAQISASIQTWAHNLPQRAQMLQYYMNNFYTILRTSELIIDASRLIQRDKYVTGVWFPFWMYIEVLLKTHFNNYVRPSLDAKKLDVADYLPSSVLKKTQHSNYALTEKPLQSSGYMAFLKYLGTANNTVDMSDKEVRNTIAQLNEHRKNVGENMVKLNELLLSDSDNSNLTTDQLDIVRSARNLLKFEYGDLTDFLKILNDMETASNETAK